ncbi:hypothetical protein GA0111570_10835 [Raineyella antarctica]|uniref:N-acetyltransferase domain-containing protein n=1 Tax=Raineyella antarctica TaxID=1577474 RepID=A0A1G6HB83_9ACTN|nr:DUF4081 domain-containing GNAT family N-acetyltransferase [Raineyella antarctica]SDB91195.1 hypothetical protein GA0111570_10835 [Raineyella antarctica]
MWAPPRPSTSFGVRTLGPEDLPAALALLHLAPVDNLYVAARVRSGGLDRITLGCPVWGYEVGGELRSMLHAGSNMVPVNADDRACAAFAAFAGFQRFASSIIGPSEAAMGLYHELVDRWGGPWAEARDIRAHQPVMLIDHEPDIAADPRVRQVTLAQWDAYADAAVAMYTEEVGQSPAVNGSDVSYRVYIRSLIQQGRSYAIVEDGRVIFKADIGSATSTRCQVQGVWVAPSHRGRGIAAPAMAAVISQARQQWPVVTLYVNDFNAPALATYRRAGMRQVGEFATVLY